MNRERFLNQYYEISTDRHYWHKNIPTLSMWYNAKTGEIYSFGREQPEYVEDSIGCRTKVPRNCKEISLNYDARGVNIFGYYRSVRTLWGTKRRVLSIPCRWDNDILEEFIITPALEKAFAEINEFRATINLLSAKEKQLLDTFYKENENLNLCFIKMKVVESSSFIEYWEMFEISNIDNDISKTQECTQIDLDEYYLVFKDFSVKKCSPRGSILTEDIAQRKLTEYEKYLEQKEELEVTRIRQNERLKKKYYLRQ